MLVFGKNSIGRQRFFKIDTYKNFQASLYRTACLPPLYPFEYKIFPHLSVAKHLPFVYKRLYRFQFFNPYL